MNQDEIDSKYCRVAATLMQEMSREFNTENERKCAFLSIVEELFGSSSVVDTGHAKSEATIREEINGRSYNLLNWEFKNGLHGITSEPTLDLLYYALIPCVLQCPYCLYLMTPCTSSVAKTARVLAPLHSIYKV